MDFGGAGKSGAADGKINEADIMNLVCLSLVLDLAPKPWYRSIHCEG